METNIPKVRLITLQRMAWLNEPEEDNGRLFGNKTSQVPVQQSPCTPFCYRSFTVSIDVWKMSKMSFGFGETKHRGEGEASPRTSETKSQ